MRTLQKVALLAVLLGGVLRTAAAPEIEFRSSPDAALAKVRRIYVDQLGGGAGSDQMRDMLISAMQNCGLFVITENPERADAVLKGSSDQKIFTEEHNTSDSIGLHASEATGSSNGATRGTNSSVRQSVSAGIAQSESSRMQERRQEVAAAVRLVDASGDVIWSTTQESSGAKFRGALADVADKVTRRLAEETKRARASVSQR